jgi:hypothetical protein
MIIDQASCPLKRGTQFASITDCSIHVEKGKWSCLAAALALQVGAHPRRPSLGPSSCIMSYIRILSTYSPTNFSPRSFSLSLCRVLFRNKSGNFSEMQMLEEHKMSMCQQRPVPCYCNASWFGFGIDLRPADSLIRISCSASFCQDWHGY